MPFAALCRAAVAFGLLAVCGYSAVASGETVRLTVSDRAGGEPTPCRVHLFTAGGEPVPVSAYPQWDDHFTCEGTAEFDLPPGEYVIECERGPEFGRVGSRFEVVEGKTAARTIVVPRLRSMASEGWRSADLHIHRPLHEVPLLAEAEGLDYAPTITWWNDRSLWANEPLPARSLRRQRNVWVDALAGEDEREGGALLFFGLGRPLPITGAGREHPSPLEFARLAKAGGAWIDVEKPFWWDAPTWLASGLVDSIGLANNHMCRSLMLENEAWGRGRDEQRLPPPRGNGYWSQELYYQILNAGLRVPPSAGSASGVLPNPVGYNRVYAHVGDDFTIEEWWAALRTGRVFVTNGPLLRVLANDELPGAVFRIDEGGDDHISLSVALGSNDPIHALEVVANGEVVRTIPLAGAFADTVVELDLPLEPGWFLVRAICDVEETFRFASTGPFYVEGPQGRRSSRAACEFFADWVEQRIERVALDAGPQRDAVLAPHRAAVRFWSTQADLATAP